jgi:hypothetical protein
MPQISQPDTPASIRPPACPDCLKPMRLTTSEPDAGYSNLRHALFVCDCGRASDQVIVHPLPK